MSEETGNFYNIHPAFNKFARRQYFNLQRHFRFQVKLEKVDEENV